MTTHAESTAARLRTIMPEATEHEHELAEWHAQNDRRKLHRKGNMRELTEAELRAVVRRVYGKHRTATCTDCEEEGPQSDFLLIWNTRKQEWYVYPQCRACTNVRRRKQYAANLKYAPWRERRQELWRQRKEREDNDPVLREHRREQLNRISRERWAQEREQERRYRRLDAEPFRDWVAMRLAQYYSQMTDDTGSRNGFRGMSLLAETTGIPERSIHRILHEGQESVESTLVDQVLSRDGTTTIGELYPAELRA